VIFIGISLGILLGIITGISLYNLIIGKKLQLGVDPTLINEENEFQWYKNNQAISGVTNPFYVIEKATKLADENKAYIQCLALLKEQVVELLIF
jgi:hypothetical protein